VLLLVFLEGVRVDTRRNLCVTFMPTSQVEIFEQVSKLPLPFFFFLFPMAAKK